MKPSTVAFALLSLVTLGVAAAPVAAPAAELEKRICFEFLGLFTKCATCSPSGICPEKRDVKSIEVMMEKREVNEDPLTKRYCIVNPLNPLAANCAKCTPGRACPLKREEGWFEVELI